MSELTIPVIKAAFDLGRILTDFPKVFWYYKNESPNYNVQFIVDELNDGQCAVVASMCAYIARQLHPKERFVIMSNAQHVWVMHDGVDYDTLFPAGYPVPVWEMWEENGETFPVTTSEESGTEKNLARWDWTLIYTFKTMCEIYNVKYPDYMTEYEEGARQEDIPCLRPYDEPVKKKLYDSIPCIGQVASPRKRGYFPKCHPNYKSPGEQLPIYCSPEEITRVRKLWDDRINQPHEPTPVKEEVNVIRNHALETFKELMKDAPHGMDRKAVIATLKNIQHQSFQDQDIFSSTMIDSKGTTKFVFGTTRNHLTESEHRQKGYKVPYKNVFPAVVIPLKTIEQLKARLAIVVPYIGSPQITIEILRDERNGWFGIPAQTYNVADIIYEFVK